MYYTREQSRVRLPKACKYSQVYYTVWTVLCQPFIAFQFLMATNSDDTATIGERVRQSAFCQSVKILIPILYEATLNKASRMKS